ncbi:MAG: flagellar basal body P-ring formation chaperone FlgA [Candidatus Zixiibacteriota bacterium]
MNSNRLKIFTISFLVIIACGAAMADENLERAIAARIMAIYDLDTADTEIEFRRNNLDAGSDTYDGIEVAPMTDAEPRGLLPFRVTLSIEGETVRKAQVSVRINRYEYALVTTDRISRHDVPLADKYTLKKVETTYLTDKALTSPEQLAGCWAKKNIGKDQIITSALIERIPAIISGKQISILYKTESMEITAAGVAMEAGYVGDLIRVRNSQSRKVIACTIIDRETVQVNTH